MQNTHIGYIATVNLPMVVPPRSNISSRSSGIESERDPGEATWAWKGRTFLILFDHPEWKKFWTPNLFEVKLA